MRGKLAKRLRKMAKRYAPVEWKVVYKGLKKSCKKGENT